MKRKLSYLVAVALLFTLAGCASMDRGHSSLQDWRRSYLPTPHG
jgi:hypothetical protein